MDIINIRICEICGKEFEPKGRQIYCSEECRKESARIRSLELQERYKIEKRIKKIRKDMRESHIDDKLKEACKQKMTYGEYQAKELLKTVPKVDVEGFMKNK